MLNNTTETKTKIIKKPEDKESSTLIWFSLDLSRSIVYSINWEGKDRIKEHVPNVSNKS